MENMTPVLITTDKDKRGVFFGYVDPDTYDKEHNSITAYNVRMCVYWSSEVHGVLGLAANGPTAKCRVSPAMPKGRIEGITLIGECSKEAVEAWEKEPWG